MNTSENSSSLPETIDEVDPQWLTGVLASSTSPTGARPELTSVVEPVGAGSAFTSKVYRVRMSPRTGLPPSVVVKLPADEQDRAAPIALGLYEREVVFYERLAADVPVRVPATYLAESGDDGSFVVVMEDLSAARPVDQITGLNLPEVGALVDALAALHAWSWDGRHLDGLDDVFPRLDSERGRARNDELAESFARGWAAFREVAGTLPESFVRFCDGYAEHVGPLIDALATPRCLAHGELRAGDVLFDGDEPVLLDFQMMQQEAGIRDVAHVLSQSLAAPHRRRYEDALLHRYWDGLRAGGVDDYPFELAERQYDLATAFSLVHPMTAYSRREAMSHRARTTLEVMLDRGAQAVADHDPLSLLDMPGVS